MTARPSATVIEFPQDRVRPAGAGESGHGSAEVMIFTGVRIERLAEEPGVLPSSGSGMSRKRRRQRR
jgi:hypothetical protein